MNVFVAREMHPGETRVPLLPANVQKLVKLGAAVAVEEGLGNALSFGDDAYAKVGADVVARAAGLARADLVLRLRKPPLDDVARMRPGAVLVGLLDPFGSPDLLPALAARGVSAVSLELLPRTTLAQKMDALSSQANLAGYVAVVLAASRSAKIFPMMSTPAGTIAPARVLVVGAGVAGLQAIATARRLGAVVEAYDTRPAVEEQVRSLGARFVKIDLGETGQTAGGYAKELTPAQLELQRQALARHCAAADVVIATAQVFGRRAPVLLTHDVVMGMAPGSLVVDLAVESGGNVEGIRLDEEIEINGVRLIGLGNLPGRVAYNASQMYANNLFNFVEHFWDRAAARFELRRADELIAGALVTHGGAVVHPALRPASPKES
ncbi:MAG: NAD(P) transhydrogenase subunit alpha [Spartobacteria bacterium]|nr:NAD(P) transhydrogenase subunit alpha [Spartobacteria bacterium]